MTWAEIERLRILGILTDLQAQVLQYRRRGFSIRQIALGMNRAPETIRHHEQAGMRRIAAHQEKETAA